MKDTQVIDARRFSGRHHTRRYFKPDDREGSCGADTPGPFETQQIISSPQFEDAFETEDEFVID